MNESEFLCEECGLLTLSNGQEEISWFSMETSSIFTEKRHRPKVSRYLRSPAWTVGALGRKGGKPQKRWGIKGGRLERAGHQCFGCSGFSVLTTPTCSSHIGLKQWDNWSYMRRNFYPDVPRTLNFFDIPITRIQGELLVNILLTLPFWVVWKFCPLTSWTKLFHPSRKRSWDRAFITSWITLVLNTVFFKQSLSLKKKKLSHFQDKWNQESGRTEDQLSGNAQSLDFLSVFYL